jgi:hypothetical protein
MRTSTEQTNEPAPALGKPIRPEPAKQQTPADRWVATGKDHERNERTGDVRLRPGRA